MGGTKTASLRHKCMPTMPKKTRKSSRTEQWCMTGLTGLESAQSEENLESKGGGGAPSASPSPALNGMTTTSRAYSSDDLRSMGAPMSGPSGVSAPPPAPSHLPLSKPNQSIRMHRSHPASFAFAYIQCVLVKKFIKINEHDACWYSRLALQSAMPTEGILHRLACYIPVVDCALQNQMPACSPLYPNSYGHCESLWIVPVMSNFPNNACSELGRLGWCRHAPHARPLSEHSQGERGGWLRVC